MIILEELIKKMEDNIDTDDFEMLEESSVTPVFISFL